MKNIRLIHLLPLLAVLLLANSGNLRAQAAAALPENDQCIICHQEEEMMPENINLADIHLQAGLSCAGELERLGLKPVVLEASDRVGGRVREADLDGSPVELGASWIHGVDGNPLTELAGEAGVGLHPFRYQLDFPVSGQQALGAGGEHRYWQAVNSFGPRSVRHPDVPL